MHIIRAIYVDDEPALLEVTKVFLEMDGDIEILALDSGRKALPLILKGGYDVIVSDYQMPEMSGIDLLKALKNKGNDVPFILFTGKGREEVAMEAINNGADFYIQKGGNPSVQFQELKNAIFKLAQKRATEIMLREREEKLRLLTDNMTDIVFEIDTKGNVKYVCPSVKAILGHDAASLIGKNALVWVHTEDREMVRQQFMRIASGECENRAKIVCRFMIASNKYLWLETIGKAIRGKDGLPTGFVLSSRDVTDRIEAEAARLDSERKYQNIIDNANDEFLIVDQGGKILEANKVASRLLGFSHKELIGMDIKAVETGSKSDRSLQVQTQSMKENVSIVETCHLAKDGRTIPVEVSCTPINLAGQPANLLIVRNISERKEVERQLRNSERLLNQTQRAAQIGGYYLDLVNGTASWTEEAYRLCGLDPFKVGQEDDNYMKLGLPWGRETFSEAWWTIPDRNTEFDFVYMLVVPNSGLRHLRNRGRLELDDEGNVKGIFGTIMDVTYLRATESRLKENQRLLDELEKASRIASFRINWVRKVHHFSDEIYRILGLKPEEDMPYRDMFELVHPDDLVRYQESMKLIKLGKEEVDIEFRVIRRDGSIVSLKSRVRPDKGPHGEVEGIYGSITDVTDRIMAEQAVRLAEIKIALMGDITRSDISRKIKTLNGYLQMALNRSHDPVIRELMAKARTTTRSIDQKIMFNEDYLNLGQTRPKWIKLDESCHSAMSKLDLGTVKVNIDLQNYEVLADPMLEKVFYKLVENSLLHGGTLSTVTISSRLTASGLVVTIQDNGRGISSGDRKKLFNWEFRGRRGHSLHLVAEVLRLSGISIQETGHDGSGSRFEISIPSGLFRERAVLGPGEQVRAPAAI